jgi:hypothetical protein
VADNFVANAGSGGSTFAADDISSVLHPRVKVEWGADGAVNDTSVAAPMPIQLVGQATGGVLIYRSIDIDESEEEVKATAGTVYGVWVSNMATTTRFLKFYNATAANVTVGSTTPVITIAIPGNTSDDVSGMFNVGGQGIAFGTAICIAATTGIADADTGAPAANDCICNVFYV